jgi:SOS response regulatory protein OraA/RecX
LRYAGRRVRSADELAGYLQRQGHGSAAVREAVRACQAAGVLDDRAAARLWAETWARAGYSAEAIRQRLAAKGFGETVVAQTSGRLRLDAGDAARARAVAAGLRRVGRARAARRLAARGFDPDTIAGALDRACGPSSE